MVLDHLALGYYRSSKYLQYYVIALVNALWVGSSVGYVLRGNADESTALTKACSVSVRSQVGRKVIAN